MTRLARTGQSCPLGKLTAEVKVRLPEETREELERQARAAGLGLSEFLREILLIRAHGIDMVRRIYEERLAMVAGIGPETGSDRGPGEDTC